MKPLSIDKALQLYKILAPYLPDEVDDDLNFVGTIIDNIKNSGNHKDYVDAIILMTGLNFEKIKSMHPTNEVLPKFIEGLVDNKIVLLKDFCRKVGFNA